MNPSTLFKAIQTGDAEQVRQLVTANPALLQSRNERQATPLLWAVYTGQTAVRDEILIHHPTPDIWEAAAVDDRDRVKAILENNPEQINATAPDGFQPLGLAAFFGHVELLGWLLDQGADPNVTAANPMRVRPIHSAAANRQPETARQLVEKLIEAGAVLNIAQHGGWTPLHQAADHGNALLVDLLLQNGADKNARSDDGRTSADMAREKGFVAVVEMLT